MSQEEIKQVTNEEETEKELVDPVAYNEDGEETTDPEVPGETGEPGEPEGPGETEPETPEEPEEPETPEEPPKEPETPEEPPKEPETPEEPETPPTEPEEPETPPTEPEIPEEDVLKGIPCNPLPHRDSVFMDVGYWVVDDLFELEAQGEKWYEDPELSKYPKQAKQIATLLEQFENVEIQESRNGRILTREHFEFNR